MSSFDKFALLLLQFILFVVFASPSTAMERRRDQFIKEPGHYIVPVPISYPGIGEGLAVIGVNANAHDTYTDYAAFALAGDFEGFGGVITDLHLIEKTLIAELAAEKLSKAAIFSYNGRGMDSGKDDYMILEIDNVESTIARLRGTFQSRMFEVQTLLVDNKIHLTSLRDRNGNLVEDMSTSQEINERFVMLDFQIDWTDDYQDPRKGVRYNISRWWGQESSASAPEYYQQEHNLTAYLPIGKISTWAFNYFQSDAVVTRMGDTDFASVENRLGMNCASLPSAEERLWCEQTVNNTIAHNRYGTAASMGGPSRLRSYPEGRYKGAHTVFYGTEIRWNLTEEFHPFDIGFAKDIRTGVQLSAFWETASVADRKDQLGNIWRDSYGVGMRLVMTSGIVLRAEIADGDEGSNIVIFFNYPWTGY